MMTQEEPDQRVAKPPEIFYGSFKLGQIYNTKKRQYERFVMYEERQCEFEKWERPR